MNIILEQTKEEFTSFVKILNSFKTDAISIENGKIIASFIGGVILQKFPEYPELNMAMARVKQSFNIMTHLLKLPVEKVIWADRGDAYVVTLYSGEGNILSTQEIAKADTDATKLTIPNLEDYSQTYNSALDKNSCLTISSAIKEYANQHLTQCRFKLDSDGSLCEIEVKDPPFNLSFNLKINNNTPETTLELSNLYEGKITSDLVINIQKHKQYATAWLVITYNKTNPNRKSIFQTESVDDSLDFTNFI